LPDDDCVARPEQAELGFDFKSQADGAGEVLLRAVAEAIDASGKRGDGFAADLEIDPGQLSRALRGRGAHFSMRWLPAVLWRDTDRRVIRLLARMAGGEFVLKPRRSRDEENDLIRRYVEDHMGEHGQEVILRALGDDR
jgi:hypothetical protein